MQAKSKISIRSKILFVLSGVVFLAVTLYLFLASRIFYEDKTLLIYELNQTNVRTLGAETEATLNRILDRLHMAAQLQSRSMGVISSEGREFVEVATVERTAGTQATVTAGAMGWSAPHVLGAWTDYLQEASSKDPDFLRRTEAHAAIPFDRVVKEGIWVRNATLPEPNSPPLMIVATGAGENSVIYAIVRMDAFLEPFAKQGIARASLVDSDGFVLADSDLARVARNESISSEPLIAFARSSRLRSGVKRFAQGDKAYLGSFYRIGLGDLVVVSEIAADEAYAAARLLARKSLLYALVVMTAAFLVALFFSQSLTAPIERLVEATRRIAQGDLGISVPVTSRDELAVLVSSFNSMSSDLRESRAKIEEYSRELESKVRERTLKLEQQNEAIREAQEALVRTARLASVGEVAGRAAHEVLNPLTNVITRVEKLRSQGNGENQADLDLLRGISDAWAQAYRSEGVEGLVKSLSKASTAHPGKSLIEEDLANLDAVVADAHARQENARKDLDFLLKEAARISKIVNGMRQLTRVSGSRRTLGVHALLGEVFETMEDLLRKSKIEVAKDLRCPSSTVLVDHDEMIQVFANLIRNAVEAITEARGAGQPVGSPARVWITAETRAPGRIQILVCDNGPGIPEAAAAKIFDASFTTKPSEAGTGLGLSIARRFVRSYDGELTLEKSEPGRETAFLIDLPEGANGG